MERNDIKAKLQDVFRELFDDKSITIVDTTSARDIDAWDSLEHINLIALIESDFKVKLNIKEIDALKNVGDIIDLLARKLGNQ